MAKKAEEEKAPKAKVLPLDEALKVAAEARALLAAPLGPEDQAKTKAVLAAALDSLKHALGI